LKGLGVDFVEFRGAVETGGFVDGAISTIGQSLTEYV
jgi:hypothetical protein